MSEPADQQVSQSAGQGAGEIAVLVGGHVQWRFRPHAAGDREVVTPRSPRQPPVPIGAELMACASGEVVGVVTSVRQIQFQRYAIGFERVSEPANQQAGELADQRDGEPASGQVEEGAPLEAIGLSARVLEALQQAGFETTGEVSLLLAEGDATLLAVEGIGPKGLAEIKAALGAEEQDADG